jgi:ABC-type sulfate transport system permease component
MSPLPAVAAGVLLAVAYRSAVWRGRFLERDAHLGLDDASFGPVIVAVLCAGFALVLVGGFR